MFYSETLLQKTGPLARVWLSANMERKLSKTHILQSNLQNSVEAIIAPDQAPMALRLSGQLLLGVVRIYSRKARYLLDDCSEALLKIKMAFRSTGNNDIPANLHIPNREALMLPDRITPYDNLELLPPPDAGWLLSQIDDVTATPSRKGAGRVSRRDINLQEDFNNSQFLHDDGLDNDDELALADMDDLELELDFGMDIDERPSRLMMDKSVEMGRDAPAPRPVEEDMFSELDVGQRNKENRDREQSMNLDFGGDAVRIAADADEGDIAMAGDDEDFQFNIGDQSAMPAPAAPDMSRARISESPLSDIDEAFAREVEHEYSRNADLYEPGDEATEQQQQQQQQQSLARNAPQRAKKRRILMPDEQTMLSSAAIKEQQSRRDNILKPQTFLPRDPYALALMEMQKNGGFVSNVLLDGRSAGWAPELKGLLSLDAVRRPPPSELKRKRDSGIADMDDTDQEQHGIKSPRLDDPFAVEDDGNDQSAAAPKDGTTVLDMAGDDGIAFNNDDDPTITHHNAGRSSSSPMPAFDDTAAPVVHPADSGPVSLGTKHAVHVLRELFGAEAATNADKRKKTSVVFQDLLPEEKTTKAEATKMFFECLVLATKDAIKVDQPEGSLGGAIRVRGKRGLWGAWAEREAGGEIANNQDEEPVQAAPLAAPAAVAVEA